MKNRPRKSPASRWVLMGLLLPLTVQAGTGAGPSAVPTFECVGLYWQAPGGAAEKVCAVSYRAAGARDWKQALPLWFDRRNQEYRGSIVQLSSTTPCSSPHDRWSRAKPWARLPVWAGAAR